MVIEHVFVTTLEPTDALREAAAFLQSRGFETEGPMGFDMASSQWTTLEMKRLGRKRARSIADMPHWARLEYDRGRVSLAVAIYPAARAAFAAASFSTEPKPRSKRHKVQVAELEAMARGLEMRLARFASPAEAIAPWDAAQTAINEHGAALRRRGWIIFIIFLLLVIGVPVTIGFIVAMNSSR